MSRPKSSQTQKTELVYFVFDHVAVRKEHRLTAQTRTPCLSIIPEQGVLSLSLYPGINVAPQELFNKHFQHGAFQYRDSIKVKPLDELVSLELIEKSYGRAGLNALRKHVAESADFDTEAARDSMLAAIDKRLGMNLLEVPSAPFTRPVLPAMNAPQPAA